MMKKMIIFEPAMCCPTGVCGPGVDPNLLRISSVINNLKNKGIVIERYNLSSDPQKFVDYQGINDLLNQEGIQILPVILVEDSVVKTKAYPTDEEICEWLEIPEDYLKAKAKAPRRNCGCKDGCC